MKIGDMNTEPNWAADPLVRLEKAVMPALLHAQEIVCRIAIDQDSARIVPDVRPFDTAINMLRSDATKMLTKFEIHPTAADLLPLETAAASLEKLRKNLADLAF